MVAAVWTVLPAMAKSMGWYSTRTTSARRSPPMRCAKCISARRCSGVARAVDDDDGLRGIDRRGDVAEGAGGVDGAHDGEAVERDSLVSAGIDLPAHDGEVTGDAGFAIGEAGAGVDVGGSRFHVGTVELGCGEAGSAEGEERGSQ